MGEARDDIIPGILSYATLNPMNEKFIPRAVVTAPFRMLKSVGGYAWSLANPGHAKLFLYGAKDEEEEAAIEREFYGNVKARQRDMMENDYECTDCRGTGNMQMCTKPRSKGSGQCKLGNPCVPEDKREAHILKYHDPCPSCSDGLDSSPELSDSDSSSSVWEDNSDDEREPSLVSGDSLVTLASSLASLDSSLVSSSAAA